MFCDLVDVAAYGMQFLVHIFYIGGAGIDVISVNRHFPQIRPEKN